MLGYESQYPISDKTPNKKKKNVQERKKQIHSDQFKSYDIFKQ